MASTAEEPAPSRLFTAIFVLIGIGAAVLAGRAITPSTLPIAPMIVAHQLRVAGPKPLTIPAKWQGKPISAWRRAYILKHSHQPPPNK